MKITTEEKSWILYAVGNSAFVLVMVTAIMPIFFKDFAAAQLPAATASAMQIQTRKAPSAMVSKNFGLP